MVPTLCSRRRSAVAGGSRCREARPRHLHLGILRRVLQHSRPADGRESKGSLLWFYARTAASSVTVQGLNVRTFMLINIIMRNNYKLYSRSIIIWQKQGPSRRVQAAPLSTCRISSPASSLCLPNQNSALPAIEVSLQALCCGSQELRF